MAYVAALGGWFHWLICDRETDGGSVCRMAEMAPSIVIRLASYPDERSMDCDEAECDEIFYFWSRTSEFSGRQIRLKLVGIC